MLFIHILEKRKQQLERIRTIRKKFGKYSIREVPLFRSEVKGSSALEKLGKELS